MRRCFIEGCPHPHKAKNFCLRHYQEFYYTYKTKQRKKEARVEELSSITGLTSTKSREVLDIILSTMKKSLLRKEPITIKGLGKFNVVKNRINFTPDKAIERALECI